MTVPRIEWSGSSNSELMAAGSLATALPSGRASRAGCVCVNVTGDIEVVGRRFRHWTTSGGDSALDYSAFRWRTFRPRNLAVLPTPDFCFACRTLFLRATAVNDPSPLRADTNQGERLISGFDGSATRVRCVGVVGFSVGQAKPVRSLPDIPALPPRPILCDLR